LIQSALAGSTRSIRIEVGGDLHELESSADSLSVKEAQALI